MGPRLASVFVAVLSAIGQSATAQNPPSPVPTSVNGNLVLDAAGPEQRKLLGAIYLVVCPGVGAGTGFLLDSGVMVTNAHVLSTCTAQTLLGLTARNEQIHFTKVITDPGRDLASLVPDRAGTGFKLAAKDNPVPGTEVSTWGYPLLYNGASPLLSIGYVSGYREDNSNGRAVKHIVVNGAFNHGNSGGPLLVARNNEVIGIVVLTYHFYPPEVKQFIDGLAQQNFGIMVAKLRKPDGTVEDLSEARITAMVLDEFYQKTQVMIGEAIEGSELSAMLREHASELPRRTSNGRGPNRKTELAANKKPTS
jgi:Trypsin-like peptidase domain